MNIPYETKKKWFRIDRDTAIELAQHLGSIYGKLPAHMGTDACFMVGGNMDCVRCFHVHITSRFIKAMGGK